MLSNPSLDDRTRGQGCDDSLTNPFNEELELWSFSAESFANGVVGNDADILVPALVAAVIFLFSTTSTSSHWGGVAWLLSAERDSIFGDSSLSVPVLPVSDN